VGCCKDCFLSVDDGTVVHAVAGGTIVLVVLLRQLFMVLSAVTDFLYCCRPFHMLLDCCSCC